MLYLHLLSRKQILKINFIEFPYKVKIKQAQTWELN